MKKNLVGLLVLISSIGICSAAHGAITGSAHDFSSAAGNWANGQICLPCHAPHGGEVITDAPLWNHVTTTASYDLYTSATFDATSTQPIGVSKLCLSCHDGTIAVDAFTNHAGEVFLTGSGDLGPELDNDHPISFTYDATLATTDGGLFDPTTKASGLIDIDGNSIGTGTIDTDLLFNERMECASCHDVHNKYGVSKLLVKSNAGSALCLTCHDK